MESRQGKPSVWQLFINLGDMEWKYRSKAAVEAFDSGDLPAEVCEAGSAV
jgi:hypothetical protein